MYVIRNLNLFGFLPEEEEERGLALEDRAAATGGEAPRQEREPETPFPFALAAAPFSLSSLAVEMDVLFEIFRRLC